MKFSILQENLNKGLNITNRFIVSKAQLSILSNILIKTDQGRIKLSATNLEIGINLWLGAKIQKEGEICVPARILTEYITSLPPQKIDLENKKNLLEVNSDSYNANFVSLPSVEFPAIPTLKKKPEISLNLKDLAKSISQVTFASTQDEGRPALTGVLIKTTKDGLVLVATDGYRLSLKEIKGIKGLDKLSKQKEILIPARALTEVGKIIGEDKENNDLGMSISKESNQVIFSTSNVEVISRLIEGKFPDFERIIPDKNITKVTVDTESFFQAVKSASIFARESSNIIQFEINNSQMEIISNSPQVGENRIKLEVKTEGKGGKIAFNSRYLLDLLNNLKSELLTFEMSSSLSPGVFKPADDKSYLHVIMPIRVQE